MATKHRDELLKWATRLENPDFHIGLADRLAIAYLIRRLLAHPRPERDA